uniref:LITAF domain-containing protein n=1 Tax=Acrobeloides nanus TaxID=290746 RepID=A0A914CJE4_9BILA
MQPNPTAPPDFEPKGPPPAYDVVFANNATNPTPVQVQPQLQQVQPQPQSPQVVKFGEFPMRTTCPSCNSSIITRTEYQAGLLSLLLCCTVSIFCLCCEFNQDIYHYCPHCNRLMGQYQRLSTKNFVLIIVLLMALGVILGILSSMSPTHRYS